MESRPGTRPLQAFYPRLAESAALRQTLAAEFGDHLAARLVEAMRTRVLPPEHADALDDCLMEAVANCDDIAWSGVIDLSHDDYAVSIHHFHGVYFVTAVDYESFGFFDSLEQARRAVHDEWDEVEEAG